ncbi:hypothetical protein [Pelotalea chapellei]|uniref:hypothetical protein n=1 Tax=Pelotalea chapellei TaxID=44671 RepID=UPI001FEC4FD2|nr:hypothetical protein [Pelotalea chapellei]
MARPLRIEYEGAIYHVTARGNERKKIFFSQKDYHKFKEYIAEAEAKFGFFSARFCSHDKSLPFGYRDTRR